MYVFVYTHIIIVIHVCIYCYMYTYTYAAARPPETSHLPKVLRGLRKVAAHDLNLTAEQFMPGSKSRGTPMQTQCTFATR